MLNIIIITIIVIVIVANIIIIITSATSIKLLLLFVLLFSVLPSTPPKATKTTPTKELPSHTSVKPMTKAYRVTKIISSTQWQWG